MPEGGQSVVKTASTAEPGEPVLWENPGRNAAATLVDVAPQKPPWWGSDYWGTPWELIHQLEAEFGKFELDACATPETAKAERFYTVKDNGLAQPWALRTWCNPPYSQKEKWLRKAALEAQQGCLVVCLLPSNTDTAWFHELVLDKAEVRFLRGRIRFIGWKGTPIEQPRNGSMLVIYHPKAATK